MADSLEERRNLRLTAGDSKTIDVTVDVDLSGTTVRYAVSDGRAGPTEVGPKTSGGAGVKITSTGASSTFEVYLDPADSQGLLGGYWHEAEFEDADGDVTTIFAGDFIVRPDSV